MDLPTRQIVTVIQDGLVLIENYFSLTQQQSIVDAMMLYGNGSVHPLFNFYRGSVVEMENGYLASKPTANSTSGQQQSDDRRLNMGYKASVDVPIEHLPLSLTRSCLSCIVQARKHSPSIPLLKNPYNCKLLYYTANTKSKLGWHQDTVPGLTIEQQHQDLVIPVVSFSFGNMATFKYKNSKTEQAKTIELPSGSALVFGGPSRMIWHTVSKIHTDPPLGPNMPVPGRFSLTFREEGYPSLWQSVGIAPAVPLVIL